VVRVVGNVSQAEAEAAAVVSATQLQTLEEVLRWGADVLDIVVQDEFTHDVVTRKGGLVFLVFDTT